MRGCNSKLDVDFLSYILMQESDKIIWQVPK